MIIKARTQSILQLNKSETADKKNYFIIYIAEQLVDFF